MVNLSVLIPAAAEPSINWASVIPAIAALLGALVVGIMQYLTARQSAEMQRTYRLEDITNERKIEQAKLDAERAYVRAILAQHLEKYALACADVMHENDELDDGHPNENGAVNVPAFPSWPDIRWELLGASEMAQARDIETRVALQKRQVSGELWVSQADHEDARCAFKSWAAVIGLQCWEIAVVMRSKSDCEPFTFPEGFGGGDGRATFVDVLKEHVAKINRTPA